MVIFQFERDRKIIEFPVRADTNRGVGVLRGFKSADSLWVSLQKGIIEFINDHDGNSSFYLTPQIIARPQWDEVEEYLKGHFDFIELKRRLGC